MFTGGLYINGRYTATGSATAGVTFTADNQLGAAGAQEAIYCLLMMRDGYIAESAHIDELDPAFADLPIVRERRDGMKLETVMSNGFGFGGTNGCLILSRYEG